MKYKKYCRRSVKELGELLNSYAENKMTHATFAAHVGAWLAGFVETHEVQTMQDAPSWVLRLLGVDCEKEQKALLEEQKEAVRIPLCEHGRNTDVSPCVECLETKLSARLDRVEPELRMLGMETKGHVEDLLARLSVLEQSSEMQYVGWARRIEDGCGSRLISCFPNDPKAFRIYRKKDMT